jgi:hypothetical protein
MEIEFHKRRARAGAFGNGTKVAQIEDKSQRRKFRK